MHWSRRLTQHLDSIGWSGADLARHASVSPTLIYKYLEGKVDAPRRGVLLRITTALGINEAQLLYGAEQRLEASNKLKLTHIDDKGEARMVDVSEKAVTSRRAVAEGFIAMEAATLALVEKGEAKKGDVIGAARIAGIMAAKRTHELIPLCHPLAITQASVDFTLQHKPPGIRVTAEVKVAGQTGVEMEALTAVSVACLTLYDMLKAADKSMVIEGVRLIEKEGGKSGAFQARARSGNG